MEERVSNSNINFKYKIFSGHRFEDRSVSSDFNIQLADPDFNYRLARPNDQTTSFTFPDQLLDDDIKKELSNFFIKAELFKLFDLLKNKKNIHGFENKLKILKQDLKDYKQTIDNPQISQALDYVYKLSNEMIENLQVINSLLVPSEEPKAKEPNGFREMALVQNSNKLLFNLHDLTTHYFIQPKAIKKASFFTSSEKSDKNTSNTGSINTTQEEPSSPLSSSDITSIRNSGSKAGIIEKINKFGKVLKNLYDPFLVNKVVTFNHDTKHEIERNPSPQILNKSETGILSLENIDLKPGLKYRLPLPSNTTITKILPPQISKKLEIIGNTIHLKQGFTGFTQKEIKNTTLKLEFKKALNTYDLKKSNKKVEPSSIEAFELLEQLKSSQSKEEIDKAIASYMSSFRYILSSDLQGMFDQLKMPIHYISGIVKAGNCATLSDHIAYLAQNTLACGTSKGFTYDHEGNIHHESRHRQFIYRIGNEAHEYNTVKDCKSAHINLKFKESHKEKLQLIINEIIRAQQEETETISPQIQNLLIKFANLLEKTLQDPYYDQFLAKDPQLQPEPQESNDKAKAYQIKPKPSKTSSAGTNTNQLPQNIQQKIDELISRSEKELENKKISQELINDASKLIFKTLLEPLKKQQISLKYYKELGNYFSSLDEYKKKLLQEEMALVKKYFRRTTELLSKANIKYPEVVKIEKIPNSLSLNLNIDDLEENLSYGNKAMLMTIKEVIARAENKADQSKVFSELLFTATKNQKELSYQQLIKLIKIAFDDPEELAQIYSDDFANIKERLIDQTYGRAHHSIILVNKKNFELTKDTSKKMPRVNSQNNTQHSHGKARGQQEHYVNLPGHTTNSELYDQLYGFRELRPGEVAGNIKYIGGVAYIPIQKGSKKNPENDDDKFKLCINFDLQNIHFTDFTLLASLLILSKTQGNHIEFSDEPGSKIKVSEIELQRLGQRIHSSKLRDLINNFNEFKSNNSHDYSIYIRKILECIYDEYKDHAIHTKNSLGFYQKLERLNMHCANRLGLSSYESIVLAQMADNNGEMPYYGNEDQYILSPLESSFLLNQATAHQHALKVHRNDPKKSIQIANSKLYEFIFYFFNMMPVFPNERLEKWDELIEVGKKLYSKS